ncbi:hypothetical protein C8R43DRAFT_1187683 [Mycena crocata]|nr:hypothetical protein C8R43DRAFT_1187683 [Mycena crocata]
MPGSLDYAKYPLGGAWRPPRLVRAACTLAAEPLTGCARDELKETVAGLRCCAGGGCRCRTNSVANGTGGANFPFGLAHLGLPPHLQQQQKQQQQQQQHSWAAAAKEHLTLTAFQRSAGSAPQPLPAHSHAPARDLTQDDFPAQGKNAAPANNGAGGPPGLFGTGGASGIPGMRNLSEMGGMTGRHPFDNKRYRTTDFPQSKASPNPPPPQTQTQNPPKANTSTLSNANANSNTISNTNAPAWTSSTPLSLPNAKRAQPRWFVSHWEQKWEYQQKLAPELRHAAAPGRAHAAQQQPLTSIGHKLTAPHSLRPIWGPAMQRLTSEALDEDVVIRPQQIAQHVLRPRRGAYLYSPYMLLCAFRYAAASPSDIFCHLPLNLLHSPSPKLPVLPFVILYLLRPNPTRIMLTASHTTAQNTYH